MAKISSYVNEKKLVLDLIKSSDYFFVNQLQDHFGVKREDFDDLCRRYPELMDTVRKKYPDYKLSKPKSKPTPEEKEEPKAEPEKIQVKLEDKK